MLGQGLPVYRVLYERNHNPLPSRQELEAWLEEHDAREAAQARGAHNPPTAPASAPAAPDPMTSAPAPASPTPWLLRWQGLLADQPPGPLGTRLSLLAGLVLCALMAGLPLVTRSGLSLLITAAGLLWLLWSLRTPAGAIRPISGWLLAMLAVAVLATGFSPVPVAAFKGLLKLVSYLGSTR